MVNETTRANALTMDMLVLVEPNLVSCVLIFTTLKLIVCKLVFSVSQISLANDFTFSKTVYGNPVVFGTAGDCYSMADCPQVSLK
jgi:hypothetical protein